jgi:predicted transglutaminase-like cysteine proteinase
MTPQIGSKANLTTPVDLTKDQVAETRRVLKEMNERVDQAIDAQVAASTPMTPKK